MDKTKRITTCCFAILFGMIWYEKNHFSISHFTVIVNRMYGAGCPAQTSLTLFVYYL